MFDSTQVLRQLADLGVSIQIEGDRLKLTPAGKTPPDILVEVKAHKGEIIDQLRAEGQPAIAAGLPYDLNQIVAMAKPNTTKDETVTGQRYEPAEVDASSMPEYLFEAKYAILAPFIQRLAELEPPKDWWIAEYQRIDADCLNQNVSAEDFEHMLHGTIAARRAGRSYQTAD